MNVVSLDDGLELNHTDLLKNYVRSPINILSNPSKLYRNNVGFRYLKSATISMTMILTPHRVMAEDFAIATEPVGQFM